MRGLTRRRKPAKYNDFCVRQHDLDRGYPKTKIGLDPLCLCAFVVYSNAIDVKPQRHKDSSFSYFWDNLKVNRSYGHSRIATPNYRFCRGYGSPTISIRQPLQPGHVSFLHRGARSFEFGYFTNPTKPYLIEV